jgi:hypothetical protein
MNAKVIFTVCEMFQKNRKLSSDPLFTDTEQKNKKKNNYLCVADNFSLLIVDKIFGK